MVPTPLYNHVLATNQVYGAGEQLTADWINESDVIKQCMLLTKIWMHQRSLDMVCFSYSNAFDDTLVRFRLCIVLSASYFPKLMSITFFKFFQINLG